jgi:flagella basal body P-ring formation protein FlgA
MLPALPAQGEDYQVISGDLILEVARSYILSHSPWDEYDVDVDFKRDMADVPVYLSGKIELKAEHDGSPGLADVNLVRVRIEIDRIQYAKINVGPYLSINLPVVIAGTDIERGQLLANADVKISEIDLTEKRVNDPITDIVDVIGYEAKQRIKKGDPVLSRHLELPLLVERGKDVTAIINATGIQVTLTGQALDNGRMGDSVRVKNRASGKIFTGEVIGQRMVEVRI